MLCRCMSSGLTFIHGLQILENLRSRGRGTHLSASLVMPSDSELHSEHFSNIKLKMLMLIRNAKALQTSRSCSNCCTAQANKNTLFILIPQSMPMQSIPSRI